LIRLSPDSFRLLSGIMLFWAVRTFLRTKV